MAARNLVVGFCTNMPVDRVAVLCRSVRRVHPADVTEIVLITDAPASYAGPLRDLGVSFQATPSDHKPSTTKLEKLFKRVGVFGFRALAGGLLDRKLCGGAGDRILPHLIEAWCHPWTARWNGYATVLKSRPYAERVLLTDIKDVIVQDDCFAGLEGDRVQLFREGVMLTEDHVNASWVRSGFGQAALDSLKGVEAICMGTVLGTMPATARFVDRVMAMFRRYPFRAVDQGTINWLLHKEGDPDYVERVPNLVGAVATVSRQDVRDALEVSDGVIVRRADGSVVPVVHMWDRWPDLAEAVFASYGERSEAGNREVAAS